METKELAKQLGISHQMTNRYKARGMPVNNLEAAIAWRNRSVDSFRSKTGRIGGNTGIKYQPQQANESASDIVGLIQQVNGTQLDLDSADADILFKNARALKEKAMALQAAAEHEKFVGSLVDKAAVEKLIFGRGRQFRDGLMSLSRRLAPVVVGCDSIPEAERLLNTEFRDILEAFCKLPVIEE